MAFLTTLCYIEKDGKYLMLHRVSKQHDINHGKWIGVGGKFEEKESPEDCVKREVLEETGYRLKSMRYRGIVTFLYQDITEYMHLFTSDSFEGEEIVCDEGDLEWVPISEACNLPIWEGDKLFFRLLEENAPFFSLKLEYDEKGNLLKHTLHTYSGN